MPDFEKVVDVLLRRSCRRSEIDLRDLQQAGAKAAAFFPENKAAIAWLNHASFKVDNDTNKLLAAFVAQLEASNVPGTAEEIAKSEVIASSPSLQGDPLTILTIGSCVALVVFAMRFTDISVSGGHLTIKAHDTRYTSENFRHVFSFLSKVIPSIGSDDSSVAASSSPPSPKESDAP